jgi:glutamate--cysteine ligase catalytic subunit
VRSGTYWFRKDINFPGEARPHLAPHSGQNGHANPQVPEALFDDAVEEEYEEKTIDEIMCGKTGLLSIVQSYVNTLDGDAESKARVWGYIDYIRRRATGDLQTPAQWMRSFIRSHPAYKFDSVVSQEINYDLMVALHEMYVHFLPAVAAKFILHYHSEMGVRHAPDLLPESYKPRLPTKMSMR